MGSEMCIRDSALAEAPPAEGVPGGDAGLGLRDVLGLDDL